MKSRTGPHEYGHCDVSDYHFNCTALGATLVIFGAMYESAVGFEKLQYYLCLNTTDYKSPFLSIYMNYMARIQPPPGCHTRHAQMCIWIFACFAGLFQIVLGLVILNKMRGTLAIIGHSLVLVLSIIVLCMISGVLFSVHNVENTRFLKISARHFLYVNDIDNPVELLYQSWLLNVSITGLTIMTILEVIQCIVYLFVARQLLLKHFNDVRQIFAGNDDKLVKSKASTGHSITSVGSATNKKVAISDRVSEIPPRKYHSEGRQSSHRSEKSYRTKSSDSSQILDHRSNLASHSRNSGKPTKSLTYRDPEKPTSSAPYRNPNKPTTSHPTRDLKNDRALGPLPTIARSKR